jgi:hypothetical protein
MDLADVDRAVSRTGRYFLDDGLWEIAVGLWLGLTVALPDLVGGAVARWAPFAMMLGAFAVRPAVLAAKALWVFPRTGRVTYPSPGSERSGRWIGAAAVGVAAAIYVPTVMARRLAPGDAAAHAAAGAGLGIAFLFAAWWWRQRRWNVLAVAMLALGLAVGTSGLARSRALAAHSGGVALLLIASGAAAFASYSRHAPKAGAETDVR